MTKKQRNDRINALLEELDSKVAGLGIDNFTCFRPETQIVFSIDTDCVGRSELLLLADLLKEYQAMVDNVERVYFDNN